ncbi:Holliday junction branch migration protein RuvA [Thermorudis peleae]|uniref:Holliday junction branch migration protein RuvA n=1 Tax=Thermorudis peleae TaxID=1382356 RepID=UPI0005720AC6|nr:Holliday junction branch migration protein RuvA [Thermorudis peleae]
MIRGLRGILVGKQPGFVLIDVQGVTFQVFTSQTTLDDLGSLGEVVSLWTHLRVREDELALYGFATEQELVLFEHLLTIGGVGPKAALSILSLGTPDFIADLIAREAVDQLSRAPGVGRKTASRIILELRGKLPAFVPSERGPSVPIDHDVVDALMALGYSAAEAREAASHLDPEAASTTEERVVAALRWLARLH